MKFKKTLSMAFLGGLLLISGMAFAAPSLMNLHSAKNHLPVPTKVSAQAKSVSGAYYYDTQIEIINNTNLVAHITIPGSNIQDDVLFPGDFVYLYDDTCSVDFIPLDVDLELKDGHILSVQDNVPNHTKKYISDYLYSASAKAKTQANAAASH